MSRRSGPELHRWIADHDPLTVVRLADPLVEEYGVPVDSRYAETYWLPVLGPSALWALRRLATVVLARPEGATVPLAALAAELGLGPPGRNAPVVRALGRLVWFGAAHVHGEQFAVRTRLAWVPLRRLPEHLQGAHERELVALTRTNRDRPAETKEMA